jgi:hypothetical protein
MILYSVSFTNPSLTTPCYNALSWAQKMQMSSITLDARVCNKYNKPMILTPFETLHDVVVIAWCVREFQNVFIQRKTFLLCSFHDLKALA